MTLFLSRSSGPGRIKKWLFFLSPYCRESTSSITCQLWSHRPTLCPDSHLCLSFSLAQTFACIVFMNLFQNERERHWPSVLDYHVIYTVSSIWTVCAFVFGVCQREYGFVCLAMSKFPCNQSSSWLDRAVRQAMVNLVELNRAPAWSSASWLGSFMPGDRATPPRPSTIWSSSLEGREADWSAVLTITNNLSTVPQEPPTQDTCPHTCLWIPIERSVHFIAY